MTALSFDEIQDEKYKIKKVFNSTASFDPATIRSKVYDTIMYYLHSWRILTKQQ